MAIQLDPIDMEKLGKIKDFIDGFKKFDEPAFLKFLGAESVETIPSNKFNAAVMALEKKKKKEGV